MMLRGNTQAGLVKRSLQEWWLFALLLAAWIFASAFALMPRSAFPDIQSLVRAFVELSVGDSGILGSLGNHVLASVLRFMAGYGLSILVGLTIGLLMATSRIASRLLLPLLRFFYPIPGLAWTPLVIMWCGLGETAVIVLIFLSAVWPILYGAYDGFRQTPVPYLLVARQLGATWGFRVRWILIPSALPIIISALRIGHGVGWRAIIGAEMIAALSGLGYLLHMGGELRRPEIVVVGMVVIAAISVIFDRTVFDAAQRRFIGRWKR